jgi:hypothetical protein
MQQQCGARGLGDPGRVAATASKGRLARTLGVLSLTSGLLLGCGNGHTLSGKSAQAKGVTLTTSSTGTAGGAKVTRAQALAFARAVNLKTADIPEGSIDHKNKAHSDPLEQQELSRCESAARWRTKLIEASSPRFTRGKELEREEISSSVTVLGGGARTAPELSRLESSHVRDCIARVLTKRFAEKSIGEAHWGRFALSRLPVQAPGADGTIGIRASTTLNFSFSEISVPIYVDVLGFSAGPVAVGLVAVSATQPVPAATEQRLLILLLERTNAHPL